MSDDLTGRADRLRALLGRTSPPVAAPEPVAGGSGAVPLGFGQRGVWFLDRWGSGGLVYSVPWVYRLTGPVDVGSLVEALRAVVDRHAVLGMVVRVVDGEPCLVDGGEVELVVSEDAADAADAVIAEEVRRGFAVGEGGGLFRVRLVAGGDAVVMVVAFHHLVWDGLSMGVFERDLGALYTSAGLPELRVGYSDFVWRQRSLLAGGQWDRGLEFWAGELAGVPGLMGLPGDRVRPVVQSFVGERLRFLVPDGVTEGLRGLVVGEGVTVFMVLLAVFDVLVFRWCGERDVVVGSPVSVRPGSQFDGVMGFFVNTVVLRVGVDGGRSFRSLLAVVRDVVLRCFEFRDVPFELVVDRVLAERPVGFSPLVQLVFGVQGEDAAPLRWGPVSVERDLVHAGTAKFDVTWMMYDRGADGLRGEVEFNTDLFDRATIQSMITAWLTVLETVVADPDRPVQDIPLLTREQRRALAPVPAARFERDCLHTRFEAVAARQPDAVAVVDGDTTVTYAALDRLADDVALVLRAAGVHRGERIGLLVEPGTAQVAAIIGTLKADAAYVPISTEDPPDRVDRLLAGSGARAVLAGHPTEPGRVVLRPVGDPPDSAGRPGHAGPDDLAYVMHTSGSTGVPKGVAVQHGNVVELVAATSGRFGFGAGDTWALFHSYAFDFAVWELWGALLHGARVVVVPRAVARVPQAFAALLDRTGVTVLNQTPSAFTGLVATLRDEPADLAVRTVIMGGEPLEPGLVRQWFHLPLSRRARLYNMLGATETTVHTTVHEVRAAGYPRSIVGRPLPHVAVAVVDPAGGDLCGTGMVGELWVGGGGVARGYLGDDPLTAQRFAPAPFAPGGGPFYRSGDLVRWDANGDLEYLGRADGQVKVRGHRVETGEVEAVAGQCPGVDGCVVAAADGRLVAFTHGAATPAGVREFLVRRLPAYMVPQVVAVPALPLTSSGKVDRAALLAQWQGAGGAAADPEPLQASGPATRQVAAVWERVLGVDGVTGTDNFFDLGGDSIRSVAVAAALRRLGWHLDLQDLFAHPTVAEVAPRLVRLAEPAARPPRPPFDLLTAHDAATAHRMRTAGSAVVDAYPMAAMQLAMVYHQELDPEWLPYHNVTGYRVRAPFSEPAMRTALHTLMRRHEILRTSFDMINFSEPMQLLWDTAPVPLAVTDLRREPAAEQARLLAAMLAEERRRPFDLAAPPLLRLHIHRLTGEEFQLTLTDHHAILDGWSFTTFLAELLGLHRRLQSGQDGGAPGGVDSRYADFVAAERQAVASQDAHAYWRRKLAGVDGGVFPEPGRRGGGRTLTERPVPAELAAGLQRAARELRVGIKTVLLAAHVAALMALTGRREVTTGVAVNGRLEESGGTDVLGLFLNTVAMRAAVREQSWARLCRGLRADETQLLPFRRLPFAHAARYMLGTRLDVLFAYNRFHALGGLAGQGIEIVDGRFGFMPALRQEQDYFGLIVAALQDPRSDGTLLSLNADASVLAPPDVQRYADLYLAAAAALSTTPGAPVAQFLEAGPGAAASPADGQARRPEPGAGEIAGD